MAAPHDSGQAIPLACLGDGVKGSVSLHHAFPNKPLKGIQGFVDDIAASKQRWDDRLTSKDLRRIGECYVNGRLEILIYFNWRIGAHDTYVISRISHKRTVFDKTPIASGIDIFDANDCNSRDNHVVLVKIAEGVETPEVVIPSVCRTYLVEKKFFGSGEGLLYRRQGSVGFEVFPLGMHGEIGAIYRLAHQRTYDPTRQVIKCGPKIMNNVTDNDCYDLHEWLYGPVMEPIDSLVEISASVVRHRYGIKRPIQGLHESPKFIDVAVGPFNL